MKSMIVSLLFAATLMSGCTDTPSASAPAPGAEPAQQAAGAPPSAPAADEGRTVTGTVVEAIDAANYTYLRLKTATGDVWFATSPMKVEKGETLVASIEMAMENFHSKALDRDFALIYFTPDVRREGESPRPALAASHGTMDAAAAAPPGGQTPAPVAPSLTEPIAQPTGGTSVADIWAKRASLAGKRVTVRGKVVKFNGGIMGRNWLHIQDGTGKADDGTHDLTVTTDAIAAVGDVVTVTGTLAVDKDFGAGYAYVVIVEGATVVAASPARPASNIP